MKTTLVLHPEVVVALRTRAKAEGRSMSSVAEEALSAHLFAQDREPVKLDLPEFDLGPSLVDVADRNALYEAMEAP